MKWLIVVGDFLVRTNFHECREDKRGNIGVTTVIESTFTSEGQYDGSVAEYEVTRVRICATCLQLEAATGKRDPL